METDRVVSLIEEYGVPVVKAVVFLVIAWIVASWAHRLTKQMLEKARFDETLTRFFAKAARVVILIIAVLACLDIFGVKATSFVAVVAAAGFAIGLAFQGTLSNFSSGVMLLVFRPFKVGDVISVAGVLGKVCEIDLFSTVLDTFDNRRMILPNSSVFGATIENVTYHPKRRVDVNVGVAYEADLDQTRRVLEETARNVPGRLEDEDIQVVLLELGDSSVNWQVRVWAPTTDYFPVKDATTRAVKMALDEAGIVIPFPQLDVHYNKLSDQA